MLKRGLLGRITGNVGGVNDTVGRGVILRGFVTISNFIERIFSAAVVFSGMLFSCNWRFSLMSIQGGFHHMYIFV